MSKRNRRVQKRMKQARREKKAMAAMEGMAETTALMRDILAHPAGTRLPKPMPMGVSIKDLLK